MGADVALFPEQWSVGYDTNFRKAHAEDPDSAMAAYASYVAWAERLSGTHIDHFRALAKELDMAIAAEYVEDVDDLFARGDKVPPRNSVALIDRHGDVVYNYAKVHIAARGDGHIFPEMLNSQGRAFYTGNLDVRGRNVTVGSFICYDREHPESARLSGLGGAELLLMPTACRINWETIDKIAVRAASNAMAIAMTNYANSSDNPAQYMMNGQSVGVDHEGRLVEVAPGDPDDPSTHPGQEGLYIAEFDIARLRQYRRTPRATALRSAPLYPQLCRLPMSHKYRQKECNAHRMWS